ncbi:MAG: hypothetical protein NC350_06555 [Corallococcus sp.]|nr:hypothetical protein [Corallococcus sp.]
MKLRQCLPSKISAQIESYYSEMQELRLRVGKPIRAKIKGIWFYVSSEGKLVKHADYSNTISSAELENILSIACEHSVYAYEEQLLNGFLTLSDGARIGCAGSVSKVDGKITSFSKIDGVNIRIAKSISGCSAKIMQYTKDFLKCYLIIGKPAKGKTTFLRDMTIDASLSFNTVVVDERGELTQTEDFDGRALNCDVIKYADKRYGFATAIRTLSPDILVCDEICAEDYPYVANAIDSGVSLYCSIHGNNIDTVFSKCRANNIKFDYYVLLNNTLGELPTLFDRCGNEIII